MTLMSWPLSKAKTACTNGFVCNSARHKGGRGVRDDGLEQEEERGGKGREEEKREF
jgi:hypothetical protein